MSLTPVLSVGAGVKFTCAAKSDGTVWCWGVNDSAELGGNRFYSSPIPVQVPGVEGALQVVAGFGHACALVNDGTVWCWGSNEYKQLADQGGYEVVHLEGLANVVELSSGDFHLCALLADGQHTCWGSNAFGQLGRYVYLSYPTMEPIPEAVGPLEQIAGGQKHSCFIDASSSLVCVGSNERLQLSGADTTAYFVQVPGFEGSADLVAAGTISTCAGQLDGSIWCWGKPGALGDGSTAYTETGTPTLVADLQDVTAIIAGDYHYCAVAAGRAYCWGDNSLGQVGAPLSEAELRPVLVPSLEGVIQISSRFDHTCAVISDGSLWCWGGNDFGQLGDGTTTDQFEPVRVVFP